MQELRQMCQQEGDGGWGRGGSWGWGGGWQEPLMVGVLPQPASLYSTPSHHLDKFIKDFLQPDKTFLDQTKKAVDIICKFLKENCFRHSATKVQKIVKVSPGVSLPGCFWWGTKRALQPWHS